MMAKTTEKHSRKSVISFGFIIIIGALLVGFVGHLLFRTWRARLEYDRPTPADVNKFISKPLDVQSLVPIDPNDKAALEAMYEWERIRESKFQKCWASHPNHLFANITFKVKVDHYLRDFGVVGSHMETRYMIFEFEIGGSGLLSPFVTNREYLGYTVANNISAYRWYCPKGTRCPSGVSEWTKGEHRLSIYFIKTSGGWKINILPDEQFLALLFNSVEENISSIDCSLVRNFFSPPS